MEYYTWLYIQQLQQKGKERTPAKEVVSLLRWGGGYWHQALMHATHFDWSLSLFRSSQLDTMDAKLKTPFSKTPKLSVVLSLMLEVDQNIAIYASPPAGNSAFLISAFVELSTSFLPILSTYRTCRTPWILYRTFTCGLIIFVSP